MVISELNNEKKITMLIVVAVWIRKKDDQHNSIINMKENHKACLNLFYSCIILFNLSQ
jgi:hypothetical protein